VRKLYLKLERPQFYALFGDYETGIDEPELARYVRAFNGVKAEYRSDRSRRPPSPPTAPNRHRRDEIQGNGLSGPYALGRRNILANSERVSIEVRDRLRSDRIVERRLLTRMSITTSTMRRHACASASRSSAARRSTRNSSSPITRSTGSPADAQRRRPGELAQPRPEGAGRRHRDPRFRRQARTNLAGADVRYRPSASTEIRAEIAVSDNEAKAAPRPPPAPPPPGRSRPSITAPAFDLLAYAREREAGFGLGQTNGAENGTRKFGLDARARLGDTWSLTGSAWHEDYLGSDAPDRRPHPRRISRPGLRRPAGLTFADDRLADGREAPARRCSSSAPPSACSTTSSSSTRQTEIPIGNSREHRLPARHRLSARYAVTSDVQLVGAYEIADGETRRRPHRPIGFDLQPWAGARIALSGNVQDIAEYGPRSFAAFGLSQSLVLDEHWSVDFSLDANKTLGGIDPARVLNPLHPVASGGFVGGRGTLTEDFTALTAGATYRAGRWSVTGRAEYRAGDQGDRYGVTAAALRQIGEGSAWAAPSTGSSREARAAPRPAPPTSSSAGRTARPAAAGRGSRSSSFARTGSTGASPGSPGRSESR
jgi:hypothetical protein